MIFVWLITSEYLSTLFFFGLIFLIVICSWLGQSVSWNFYFRGRGRIFFIMYKLKIVSHWRFLSFWCSSSILLVHRYHVYSLELQFFTSSSLLFFWFSLKNFQIFFLHLICKIDLFTWVFRDRFLSDKRAIRSSFWSLVVFYLGQGSVYFVGILKLSSILLFVKGLALLTSPFIIST